MAESRYSIQIQGIVQGVGFRAFVYRLAHEWGIVGWVRNQTHGVEIDAQGEDKCLLQFIDELQTRKPIAAEIRSLQISVLKPIFQREFTVRRSETSE